MYDTLLFLHVLSAFIAFVTVAAFTAYGLGAPVGRANFLIADWSWNVSGTGLLVFGVWLALYVDGYELWDGWILGALGLFVLASLFGAWARRDVLARLEGDATTTLPDRTSLWNWLRALSIVAILVLMIWKPGA